MSFKALETFDPEDEKQVRALAPRACSLHQPSFGPARRNAGHKLDWKGQQRLGSHTIRRQNRYEAFVPSALYRAPILCIAPQALAHVHHETDGRACLVQWLTYWIIFALMQTIETFGYWFLLWCALPPVPGDAALHRF